MTLKSKISRITLVLSLALSGIAMSVQAEEATQFRVSKSISYASSAEHDETARKASLDQADTNVMQTLRKVGFRPESNTEVVILDSVQLYHDGDVTIYDATTTLISDFNGDGFYHRFSVTFDADTVYSDLWIYAKLYLSYEGGPWNHFSTSDDFIIYSDSVNDEYVVETELADGFPTGYYDIRIELYDAHSGEWLTSYGSYDDYSLSALPLEDSVYDDDYYGGGYSTEVLVAGHGGLGIWFLVAFGLAGLLRKKLKSVI